MNLSELERLANLPPCQVDWCDRKDVLAMIELLREMAGALESIGNTACGEASHQFIALQALAKYKEMTK